MTKLYPELFTASDSSCEGAREHSEKLDQLLGFQIPKIEKQLLECAQSLNPGGSHKSWGQILQTPYSELKQMCELLNPAPGSRLIDLWAGYGRMGPVLAGLYPEVYFVGYDYGAVAHIRKTLSQLEMLAMKKNFKVIARGQGTRSLIQYERPWLSDIYPPIHQEQYSIFSMSQNF